MLNRAERYQIRNKHRRLAKVLSQAVHLRAVLLLLCPTALPCSINLWFLFHAYTLAHSRKMSNTFAYFFTDHGDVLSTQKTEARTAKYILIPAGSGGICIR